MFDLIKKKTLTDSQTVIAQTVTLPRLPCLRTLLLKSHQKKKVSARGVQTNNKKPITAFNLVPARNAEDSPRIFSAVNLVIKTVIPPVPLAPEWRRRPLGGVRVMSRKVPLGFK